MEKSAPNGTDSGFFTKPDASEPFALETLERISASPGGYSELYLCRRAGKFRVLKCLKPQFRGNKLYESLLRKEFDIAFHLSHDNICECYAFLMHPQLGACMEIEWVDGLALDDFLIQEKPGKNLEEKVLTELCDALSYIHSKQVIHKDLKPSNVLVTHKGHNVKLIDFGFADSDSYATLKLAAGTPASTAPEVLAGAHPDIRSDIYSLGMILFLFPERYHKVARRCCSSRPSARYGSVQEVKKALFRKRRPWAILPVVLAVAAIALYLLSGRAPKSEDDAAAPAGTAIVFEPDTNKPLVMEKVTPPAPASPPETKGTAVPRKDNNAVDEAAIDELFRQATELFD